MCLIIALVVEVFRHGHRYLWLDRKHGFIVDNRWLKEQWSNGMLQDVFVQNKLATRRYQVENPIQTVLNKTDLIDEDKFKWVLLLLTCV
jgi:hypothetical protein